MYHYVNHQAINEFFKPMEVETDPKVRLELITHLQPEVIDRLVTQIALTCYELKLIDWSTGQIAEAFGLSERRVKALIRFYSKKSNSHNPLERYQASNIVDISHLVAKDTQQNHPELASPTRTQV
jgi:hypothetical protein